MDTNENNSIDSNNDSFVWQDYLEDDDMISEDEGGEDDMMGISCKDFNWDQQSAMSAFTIYFDCEEDVVSALDIPSDDRSTDSTILTVHADWFSIDTEIDALEQPPMKQAYIPDTIEEAIRLAKRDKRRSVVMAKMLRLEASMQKLGVQLGTRNEWI